MRALVWGAGAIGGTVAAFAARAGFDVTLVDTFDAHVRAVRERGLRIEGPIETFTQPLPAFTPEELEGEWPVILLCVKAHHTDAALDALAPHLAQDGWVASLQNGLNERRIAQRLGAERTVGAFVNFGADVLAPGRIHFGGRGAFVIGELDGADTPRLRALHELVSTFDPDAERSDDVWAYLWGKMGYGVMLFASALTDESIADALERPEAQPVLTALAREVLRVAHAEGVAPRGFNGFDPVAFGPEGTDAARAASFEAMVAHNRRSAKTHSGVWRDLAVHGRKTEIDAQYGPVLEMGAAHDLALPHVRALVALMHEVEAGERPRAWDNLLTVGERAAGTAEASA